MKLLNSHNTKEFNYDFENKNFSEKLFKHKRFESFLLDSVKNRSIYAYKHTGLHITVNTLSELEEAKKNINKILIG